MREGGREEEVTVAEGGREVRGGGKRGGRSTGGMPRPTPTPTLLMPLPPPSSGISLDSRRIASRELSRRPSGPTRAPRSTRPPGTRSANPPGTPESMLVRGGGTDMCGGWGWGGASFCSDEDEDCDDEDEDCDDEDDDDDKDCGSGRCRA